MSVIIHHLGKQDYQSTWERMQEFNLNRDASTADEIWLLEHPPVFTLGLNGKPEHIHDAGNIPVIETDRGGQVTYHGPGQLIVYLLFDVRRNKLGIRQMVTCLERAVIDLLKDHDVEAYAKKEAPGVYVNEKKIAALGLRVKQGGTYHGLSLNVDMDLSPFNRINPCGYPGLEVINMSDLGLTYNVDQVAELLLKKLYEQFDLTEVDIKQTS